MWLRTRLRNARANVFSHTVCACRLLCRSRASPSRMRRRRSLRSRLRHALDSPDRCATRFARRGDCAQLSELKLYVNKYGVRSLKTGSTSTAALLKQVDTLGKRLTTLEAAVRGLCSFCTEVALVWCASNGQDMEVGGCRWARRLTRRTRPSITLPRPSMSPRASCSSRVQACSPQRCTTSRC